jgi:RNA polymerase sigma-70 factor, ECF subfamily
MMELQDSECIEAYLNGNPNALSPLVEKYKRPLYSFILKMTEGREDADEIFQETWFRALKNLHSFKHHHLLNWLFRIAHNLIIDRARRNKRMVSIHASSNGEDEESDTLESRLSASALTPADDAAGSDLGTAIDAAVGQLADEQKEVYLMRMYGNLSFKEIASIQGCSINTCLARMQYALTKLRSILQKQYDELQETER